MPVASSSHAGCDPQTVTPTQTIDADAAGTYYLQVIGTHVWLYSEANGIDGLQPAGGCSHRADNQMAHVCSRLDTRIPGTILCLVDTA